MNHTFEWHEQKIKQQKQYLEELIDQPGVASLSYIEREVQELQKYEEKLVLAKKLNLDSFDLKFFDKPPPKKSNYLRRKR